MPNDSHIFVPRNIPLEFPAKMVMPGRNMTQLRCGAAKGCGAVGHFRPHIIELPEEGTARIAELVCLQCGHHYPLDDNGRFVRGGKREP